MNFSSQSKGKIRLLLGFIYRNKPLSTVKLHLWRYREEKLHIQGWESGTFIIIFWFKFLYCILLISMLASGTILTTIKSLTQRKVTCVNTEALTCGRCCGQRGWHLSQFLTWQLCGDMWVSQGLGWVSTIDDVAGTASHKHSAPLPQIVVVPL